VVCCPESYLFAVETNHFAKKRKEAKEKKGY